MSSVQIYPAIDIKRGKTTYTGADPVAVAERFLGEGASWLHVVDMDRAFDTGRNNAAQVRSIARLPGASVQLGGLLRTPEQVREGVDAGARRLVAATLALLDAELLDLLMRAAGPDAFAISIDVKRGNPVLRGSSQALEETPADLAGRARKAGVRTVVYRDLERDGQLTGFDIEGGSVLLPVVPDTIMAGGGSSLDDLRVAQAAGFSGAIIGRALYEGRFTLREAIECSRS